MKVDLQVMCADYFAHQFIPSSDGLNYEFRPSTIANASKVGIDKGTPIRARRLTVEPKNSGITKMHMSETAQVMEALSASDANMKLHEGWSLISVVVTTHPNGQLHPCYILAKSKAVPSHQKPD
jgi:hypothetical protein